MTRIKKSGTLQMKTGPDEWSSRYVIVVGYTIGWFRAKSNLKNKYQPIGCVPLIGCRTASLGTHFNFKKLQKKSGKEATFGFRASSEMECKRWIKCLNETIEECMQLMAEKDWSNLTEAELHSFGLYHKSINLFQALQSGAIVANDISSERDFLSRSHSVSKSQSVRVSSETEAPRFYTRFRKEKAAKAPTVDLQSAKLNRSVTIRNLATDLKREHMLEDEEQKEVEKQKKEKSKVHFASQPRLSASPRNSGSPRNSALSNYSKSFDLIRPSVADGNMHVDVLKKHGKSIIDGLDVLKEGWLFYWSGSVSNKVYLRLTKEMIYLFDSEDQDDYDCIGQIDFRSITTVKQTNEDTFELRTALNATQSFSMYDTKTHNASRYVDIITKKCHIPKVPEDPTSLHTTLSIGDEPPILAVTVEDTPWYYYPWIWLCPCWIKRRYVTIFADQPEMDKVDANDHDVQLELMDEDEYHSPFEATNTSYWD